MYLSLNPIDYSFTIFSKYIDNYIIKTSMINQVSSHSTNQSRRYAIVLPFLFLALQWSGQDTIKKPDIKVNFQLQIDQQNKVFWFDAPNDSSIVLSMPWPTNNGYRLLASAVNGFTFHLKDQIHKTWSTLWNTIRTEINTGAEHFTNESKQQISHEFTKLTDTLKQEINAFLNSEETKEYIYWNKKKELAEFCFYVVWVLCFLTMMLAWWKFIVMNNKK